MLIVHLCTSIINIRYLLIFLNLDTMITLILLLAILHTGLSVKSGYEEVEKNLLKKLGKMYTNYI